jgi:uncharacterized protein
MPRVIHFEIGAEIPDRAIAFYEEVFGWEVKKWEGPMEYYLLSTVPKEKPGIDGGLFKKPGQTSQNIINTIDVPNIDEFMDKVKNHGGEILGQKSTVPGVGYMAYCKDTEGNFFGIMQEDPNAK